MMMLLVDVVRVDEWDLLKEHFLLGRLTLAKMFSLLFVGKMCVFISRPMKIVTFP